MQRASIALFLCWLVWSIFIGCVCGRGPVVVSDLCVVLSGKRLLVYLLLFLPIYLFVLHSYKEHLCATFVSIDCPLQFDLCGFFWYFSEHFMCRDTSNWSETCGSRDSGCVGYCHLEYYTVQSGRSLPTFWNKLSFICLSLLHWRQRGRRFLRNVGNGLPGYTVLHLGRH